MASHCPHYRPQSCRIPRSCKLPCLLASQNVPARLRARVPPSPPSRYLTDCTAAKSPLALPCSLRSSGRGFRLRCVPMSVVARTAVPDYTAVLPRSFRALRSGRTARARSCSCAITLSALVFCMLAFASLRTSKPFLSAPLFAFYVYACIQVLSTSHCSAHQSDPKHSQLPPLLLQHP